MILFQHPITPAQIHFEEKMTPKENSSLTDGIGEQHRQQYAFVATPTKHSLIFTGSLKNTLIASEPDTPDTPNSDSKMMMKLMRGRNFHGTQLRKLP